MTLAMISRALNLYAIPLKSILSNFSLPVMKSSIFVVTASFPPGWKTHAKAGEVRTPLMRATSAAPHKAGALSDNLGVREDRLRMTAWRRQGPNGCSPLSGTHPERKDAPCCIPRPQRGSLPSHQCNHRSNTGGWTAEESSWARTNPIDVQPQA